MTRSAACGCSAAASPWLHSIQRGVFTQGRDPFRYLKPLGAHLFLSANATDVQQALQLGFPAARVLTESAQAQDGNPEEVRIAFDGDAVLFSDEAERVFQARGWMRSSAMRSSMPPVRCRWPLQAAAGGAPPAAARYAKPDAHPHRAGHRRSAPAHERAIRTLMDWNIGVDETMFLGRPGQGRISARVRARFLL
ncbi:5'-nucleotidase [Comamonas sp. JC664]|uniref:5'-nucleotidase n=1 Tax=Comamonas sp. JC664 TaxID=2801917 RepID=UPI00361149A3